MEWCRPMRIGVCRCHWVRWRVFHGGGLRTIFLQKNSQGFGFTLRHFIVYPPESSLHSIKDEENGNELGKGCQQAHLEPMDTIFVKSVKENGPAQQAGLCTGDRLVKVNGESILGKTYSQVIAYSQDAYLKGNEPYSGEAQNLPEPPPLCYSSTNGHFAPSGWHRGRSSSAITALDFHFANHNAAIASATLPPPRKSSLQASARSHADTLCHRALSDWYYSQAEAAERMSPRDRSISQDRLAELGLGLALGPRPTISTTSAEQQSLLAAYAEYEHNYGRSVETLAQASALVSPRYEHTSQTSSTVPPSIRQSGQQVAEPQTRRVKEEEPMGYKSYSPSFSRKAGHLMQQAHSFREPGYGGPYLNRSPSRGSPADNDGGVVPRPQSTPALEVTSMNQEVVLRQKPPLGRRTPIQALRHPHYTTPVESPEPPGTNGSLAEHAYDSLSSIPFIDEPTSPSTDLQACYVPACSVVSSSQASTMATLTSTSVSPTLSSISPPVRLRSQDCSSIKGRRSSYLLAITTERSKSCDEGLNTFREEGRVFSKLPKRVKSFFTDGSLESLRAQEEARSKRHSTSELGTITFSDVRKEGWLHYKQILTEKGKKVGGGMRPWKRVFSVLRSHSLFLYKDKREAVLHGAGAGPSQDEHPPISIRGCLIDIAYSETKRKHTLRLTTQDFCEYLLQAEDREDMLAWIKVIRENSKTDNEEIGFSRQALINKKLNDYRKHSLTGNKPDSSPRAHRMMPPFLLAKTDNTSVNRASRTDDNKALWGINIMKKNKKTDSPKAFGVRLEDCQPAVNHKFVPLIVEMCCGVVEATGLEYTGIYRVPGNNAMVSNLQEHLNKGMDINTAEERWQDLNVISSLLKSFFRKLPEPLFTDDKYGDFIDANRIEDAEDRLKTMKKLIHDLPDHYYHTLKFLVGHLKKVADHSEKNKMEPRNLALVFGPTLVRTSEDNMTDMVTHMPDRYKIVETLILHYDWFFSDGDLDGEEKVYDKRDMQPVPNIDHLLSNIGRPGMPGEASGEKEP
uniref:Rho GTPase activating protein 23b n=1 Tax=Anabas testudineus TaxID=64144 RepID=A0A3Q1KFB6_ANATE